MKRDGYSDKTSGGSCGFMANKLHGGTAAREKREILAGIKNKQIIQKGIIIIIKK